MASIKTMASTAKKSAAIFKKMWAKIISMAATMAASMNLAADDAQAMECAFADMVEEYGQECIIIDMDPFDGFCA